MNKVLEATKQSLKIVAKAITEKNIDKYLEGERTMSIFKRETIGNKND